MTSDIAYIINRDTGISVPRIEATIKLIQEGSSISFIARYRKEATNNLDELQLRLIAKQYISYATLAKRRSEILASIGIQGGLTPELQKHINGNNDINELEDFYLPYRSRRQSKANLARRRGLESLADCIHQQTGSIPVENLALRYISFPKKVPTVAVALEGALHIIAERISENLSYRKWLRNQMLTEGTVTANVVKNKQRHKTKYSMYHNFSEPVAKIPPHRYLAIRRGTREKALSYSIQIDDQKSCARLKSMSTIDPLLPFASLIEGAITDSYDRLLKPVIENEVREILRIRSEDSAITEFQKNLSSLLLAPPAGLTPVLGIEPSQKGKSKLAVVGPSGSLLEHHSLLLEQPEQGNSRPEVKQEGKVAENHILDATGITQEKLTANTEQQMTDEFGTHPNVGATTKIEDLPGLRTGAKINSDCNSPLEPQLAVELQMTAEATVDQASPTDTVKETNQGREQDSADSAERLVQILNRTGVRGILIGNGVGARPAEMFVRSVIRENELDVFVVVATDSVAGAYASSKRARHEFPTMDTASRRAIFIARRLQDPLNELVRIDPKSIRLGQYQNDVDQKKLTASLETAMESAVNHVGADLNRASISLLQYISGLSPEVAQAIGDYRRAKGPFRERNELLKVEGIDGKTFEQASGFLRIINGVQPLDCTSIHPECYKLVEQIAQSINASVTDILGNPDQIRSIKFQDFEKQAGRLTLIDIRRELLKPVRDPRKNFVVPKFRDDIHEITDLKEGMELEGNVTNLKNFGVFVDIGVQQQGLVHISELSHNYVSDPRQAAQVGDVVKVKVIGVDSKLKRISLSVKAALPKPPPRPKFNKKPVRDAMKDKTIPSDKDHVRHPKTKEAAMARRKRNRTLTLDRRPKPTKPAEPARQLSMEEKIRLLQEKFKGPRN